MLATLELGGDLYAPLIMSGDEDGEDVTTGRGGDDDDVRDSRSIESSYYLSLATTQNYTPAWQEKLTASEMRAQFGDLDARVLIRYLDAPCLNKLLARHYVG